MEPFWTAFAPALQAPSILALAAAFGLIRAVLWSHRVAAGQRADLEWLTAAGRDLTQFAARLHPPHIAAVLFLGVAALNALGAALVLAVLRAAVTVLGGAV